MKSSYDLYSFASINKTLTNVTIELNSNCNWRCKHCYIDDYSSSSILNLDILDKLFNDLRSLGVIQIVFTGGEIFLRKDLLEIIKLARGYFFNVSLFTNASLLNENIVKQLSDLNIEGISCTLFSMEEDIHDKFTENRGSLKKTLNNLKLLYKYGLLVEVKHIVTTMNQYEYEGIAKYCEEMGFKFLATTSIMPKRDDDQSPLELAVGKRYLEKNLDKIDYYRKFSSHIKNEELFVCNGTRYSLFIQSNGDIHPCNNHLRKLGNILVNDIKDIWKNSEYLKWLQSLKWKELKECNECESSSYCLRCAGVAHMEHQDVLGCNQIERVNANTRKILSHTRLENKVGKVFGPLC